MVAIPPSVHQRHELLRIHPQSTVTLFARFSACPHPSRAPRPCDTPSNCSGTTCGCGDSVRSARACGLRAAFARFDVRIGVGKHETARHRVRALPAGCSSASPQRVVARTVTTGISAVTSASGPCFSSPAGRPRRGVTDLLQLHAPSRAMGFAAHGLGKSVFLAREGL